MKRWTDRLLVGGFIGTLYLLPLTFFFLPLQQFSDLENRYLQKVPQLSWESVWSKKYAEEAERFVTDHFPFRDRWVLVKSAVEQLRLQQENNGIYLGKDGYLFEKFATPDAAKVQQYGEAVTRFADRHPETNVTLMLAPTSVGLYANRLPWLAPVYPLDQVNQSVAKYVQGSVSFLNGFDFLTPHASEPIYYRTDHHWTTYGAYLAYAAYAQQMGWQPIAQQDFQIRTVSESFLGSYHTRGQFTGVTPDSIQVYTPSTPVATEMYIADTDETFTSLYDARALKKKDQYSYFLGGVHALMRITSQLEQKAIRQENLLVIKDSYAHSVIPFLALHIPDIHVIDIRYYNGNISDYLADNGIQNVLLLFNTATFVENTAILKVDD